MARADLDGVDGRETLSWWSVRPDDDRMQTAGPARPHWRAGMPMSPRSRRCCSPKTISSICQVVIVPAPARLAQHPLAISVEVGAPARRRGGRRWRLGFALRRRGVRQVRADVGDPISDEAAGDHDPSQPVMTLRKRQAAKVLVLQRPTAAVLYSFSNAPSGSASKSNTGGGGTPRKP